MISSSYWKCKENKVVLAISLLIYVVALFNTSHYPDSHTIIPHDSDWAIRRKKQELMRHVPMTPFNG